MCCIFPTRRHKPSEHQTASNGPTQATARSSTPKRQPSRLIKLNSLASTEPVQTRRAAIPLPPKYRARGLNTPRVQDMTDPAIRTSLFGPFAQTGHQQHYGFGFDASPKITHHNAGHVRECGSTRCGNDDVVDKVHPSSTCSTKDDSGSGGHAISLHQGHGAFVYASSDISGFSGGHSVGYSDGCGTDGAGGGCD